jgi:hypothetical protein
LYRTDYRTISKYVKMFSSICTYTNSVYVSHGKYISVFDIEKNKWTKHFELPDLIHTIKKIVSKYYGVLEASL